MSELEQRCCRKQSHEGAHLFVYADPSEQQPWWYCGVKKPVNTIGAARAAAREAGKRSAKAAGRTSWDETDYAVAGEVFKKLWPEG